MDNPYCGCTDREGGSWLTADDPYCGCKLTVTGVVSHDSTHGNCRYDPVEKDQVPPRLKVHRSLRLAEHVLVYSCSRNYP